MSGIKGQIIVILILLITLNLFLLSKNSLTQITSTPFLSLSQIFSLLGFILFSISFVLSARFKFAEIFFGGYDKVYCHHRTYAIISFILLLHHPLLLAVNSLPRSDLALRYIIFSDNISYNLGQIALYVMVVLLVLTLLVNLPYQIWLATHKLMGVPFIISGLHILVITSDISRYQPLRYWILSFLVVGTYSYLYRLFLSDWFISKHEYLIDHILITNGIVDLRLRPINKPISFIPGQLAYLQFHQSDLDSEIHPFTIASSPDNHNLRFCIKTLGDFTQKLEKLLSVGTHVTVRGPYGSFAQNFSFTPKDAIFISGGIGITPFLGLIESETFHPQPRKIHFFSTFKNPSDDVFKNELSATASRLTNLSYYSSYSSDGVRLSALSIATKIGNLNSHHIYICGPTKMMEDLSDQFRHLGVPGRNIHFENFALK